MSPKGVGANNIFTGSRRLAELDLESTEENKDGQVRGSDQ